MGVLLLGDARAEGQAGGQFELEPQHDAEEIGAAQNGVVAKLGEVGRNLHGVRPEADLQALAIGLAGRGKFHFIRAGDFAADFELEDVHDADELGDEFVGGLFIDLARGADLLEVAAGEDDDAVGHLHSLFLVVGDEQGGDVEVVVEMHEPLAQFLPDLGVHGAEGFVEQEHGGLGGEGAGNGDALALAARQLMREPLFQPGEAKELHEFGRAGFDVRAFPFLDFEAERDVLEHVHVLEQGVILEDEADVAFADGDVVDTLAADEDVPGRGDFEAGDHAEDGGLAAAAGTEQRHEFAFLDGKADVIDGGGVAEILGDAFQFDAHAASRPLAGPAAVARWPRA